MEEKHHSLNRVVFLFSTVNSTYLDIMTFGTEVNTKSYEALSSGSNMCRTILFIVSRENYQNFPLLIGWDNSILKDRYWFTSQFLAIVFYVLSILRLI